MDRDLMEGYATVWVFSGGGLFPSGVFTTREKAEDWIARNGLSGTLTQYPVDTGFYDWAVAKGDLHPVRPDQSTPAFIQRFASGYRHYHYQDGAEGRPHDPRVDEVERSFQAMIQSWQSDRQIDAQTATGKPCSEIQPILQGQDFDGSARSVRVCLDVREVIDVVSYLAGRLGCSVKSGAVGQTDVAAIQVGEGLRFCEQIGRASLAGLLQDVQGQVTLSPSHDSRDLRAFLAMTRQWAREYWPRWADSSGCLALRVQALRPD